jgi:two-component system phosphate regulon response regulator PhoB
VSADILIVEDEAALVELLRYNLDKSGFATRVATDGEEALAKIEDRVPDLVLLDWMLPGVSGIEICRRLRRRPETARLPIVMLTARTEEADRLRGLETGADDYVSKPFSVAELLARIKGLLRRAKAVTPEGRLVFGDIVLDLAEHRVTRAGRAIALNPNEFRLLRHLMEHPRRVFARERLLDSVWPSDAEVEPRTVDVAIRRLRRELNGPGEADLIRTVRSAGYALDDRTDG